MLWAAVYIHAMFTPLPENVPLPISEKFSDLFHFLLKRPFSAFIFLNISCFEQAKIRAVSATPCVSAALKVTNCLFFRTLSDIIILSGRQTAAPIPRVLFLGRQRDSTTMPGDSRGLSWYASRAATLLLLAVWAALVVSRFLTFLSEPTGTETHYETALDTPYVTICAYSFGVLGGEIVREYVGLPEEALEFVGNGTLQDLFRRGGYKLTDIMHDPLPISKQFRDDPNRENYTTEHGNWTTSINYRDGGICHTLQAGEGVSEVPLLTLNFYDKRPGCDLCKKEKRFYVYTVHVHRLPEDFWGQNDLHFESEGYAAKASSNILPYGASSLKINIEREIMPNMRRRPCVEDPTYSRSMCWRNCFFDSLNCSVTGNQEHQDKPLCRAVDWFWYRYAYASFTQTAEENSEIRQLDKTKRKSISYPCPCPHSCILDRYKISNNWYHPQSYIKRHINLSFRRVVQVFENTVTYGSIDLMSDMGGFLGLFLGYSILSVFDDIKAFLIRALSTRKACKVSDPIKDSKVDQHEDSKASADESQEINVREVWSSEASPEQVTTVIKPKINIAWIEQE